MNESSTFQDKLAESKLFLRGALDSIPSHIAILDEHGTILFLNEHWKEFAKRDNFQGAQLGIGKNYLQLSNSSADSNNEAAVKVAHGIRSVINRKCESFQLEYECQSETGKNWFLITTSRFRIESPTRLVVSHQSITGRKRAEQRLSSKEKKLRSIYDSSSDAILLMDQNGFFDCNAKAVQMFGFSRIEELVGIPPSEISPALQPDGQPSFVKADQHVRMALQLGENRFEWLHVRRNGKVFPAEVLLTTFEYQERQVLQATVRDITERKQAEEKLQALNQQLKGDLLARTIAEKSLRLTANQLDVYRKIVDHHAIVAETDISGIILSVNDAFCRISGYSREELVGQNHRILNSGLHPKSMWTEMYRTVLSGGCWHGEICNRNKDGKLYWVDTTIASLYDDMGKIRGFFSIHADISSLKQAQVQAESANRSKSEFLANMSHEIRTPMTAILGYADLLAEGLGEKQCVATTLDYIDTIKRNGEHLLAIINDILDISKIEADKMTIERIDVSPVQIVREVLDLMKVKSSAKGLSLEAKFDSLIPKTIQTDPTRLRQILVNLVGNSIKFTEVGGVTVAVGLAPDRGSHLRFDVIDTGIGLTKEQMSRLFQSFEQIDTSTTRKYGGSGLGLRISKRLAEMLGGDITVSNVATGGCVFSASIATASVGRVSYVDPVQFSNAVDIINELNDPAKKQVSDVFNPRPLSGLRILFAEDGPDNQRLISFHLRKAGAEVILVDNGKLAVESLTVDGTTSRALTAQSPFDIILMDMQMPLMDGYEASKLLREKGCILPILALTAHAMESDLERSIVAGCNIRLTKPIDRSVLIAACVQWGLKPKALAIEIVGEASENRVVH